MDLHTHLARNHVWDIVVCGFSGVMSLSTPSLQSLVMEPHLLLCLPLLPPCWCWLLSVPHTTKTGPYCVWIWSSLERKFSIIFPVGWIGTHQEMLTSFFFFFKEKAFFLKILFTCLFLSVLGLHCCALTFSSCGQWGLLTSCSIRASHCSAFSYWGAYSPPNQESPSRCGLQ